MRAGPYPPTYWGRERPQSERVAIARVGARLEDIAQYVYGTPVAARGLAALNGLDPFAPLGGGVVVHLTGKPLAEPALSSLVSSRPLPANCGDPDLFMMRKGMLDVSLDLDFNFIVRAIDEGLSMPLLMGRHRGVMVDIFRKWGEEKFTEFPWAYPNGGDYLDRLFMKLTNKTKILSGVFTDEWTNYYSLLFNRLDPGDEIAAIRDRYSAVNRGDSGVAELSFASMLWDDVKTGKVRDRIFAGGRGAVKGVVSAAKGTAHFVKTLVTDPKQALRDIANIPGALKSLWTHRSELFDKFMNASPEEQAEMIGEFFGQLEFAIGTAPVPGAAAKGLARLGEVPGVVGTAARALNAVVKVPGKVLGAATGVVKTIVFKGVAFAAEGAVWAAKGLLKIGERILRGTWSVVNETVGAVTQRVYYFYDEAAGVLQQIREEIARLFVKCTNPCDLTAEAKQLAIEEGAEHAAPAASGATAPRKETFAEFLKRGGTPTKVAPGKMPKSQAEVTAVPEPALPEGFEDMPHGEIRTRKQAGVSLEEIHHIASKYVKENKAIFKKVGLKIDDDLNLIKDFQEHGQLRGSYDWSGTKYKFEMKGHHDEYNEWVTRLLNEATPAGLAPDQALRRITKVLEELNTIIRKHPEVLSHGPRISPALEQLTFRWD
ncbi:MAG: hypothetical protein DMD40_03810 [Gemmatimonadetes bacterium]|nr:MAG: hypothetical protein DMD40_03810 [Gemmatimonadota bacterium]